MIHTAGSILRHQGETGTALPRYQVASMEGFWLDSEA